MAVLIGELFAKAQRWVGMSDNDLERRRREKMEKENRESERGRPKWGSGWGADGGEAQPKGGGAGLTPAAPNFSRPKAAELKPMATHRSNRGQVKPRGMAAALERELQGGMFPAI